MTQSDGRDNGDRNGRSPTEVNTVESTELDRLADTLQCTFSACDAERQQLSMALYRLLADGEPVTCVQLAERLNVPLDAAAGALRRVPNVRYNAQDRIIGYGGLSVEPTAHRFEAGGRVLYTWCAWDALFLPEILDANARVESRCPVTREPVRLAISPDSLRRVEPAEAVVSFLKPRAAEVRENVVAHFCSYVHFFSSADAGEHWIIAHPGAFLLTVAEAYGLGRRLNAARYPG